MPPVRILSAKDSFYLADFTLNFAADLFGCAAILQIGVACRASGFLFNLAFGLLNSAFDPIFRARFHTSGSHVSACEVCKMKRGSTSKERTQCSSGLYSPAEEKSEKLSFGSALAAQLSRRSLDGDGFAVKFKSGPAHIVAGACVDLDEFAFLDEERNVDRLAGLELGWLGHIAGGVAAQTLGRLHDFETD